MTTTIKNNKSCKHETFIQNKVNLTCMQKVEIQKCGPRILTHAFPTRMASSIFILFEKLILFIQK